MRLRMLGVLVAVLASLPGGSASATGAGAFSGTVNISCFGCGTSSGTGDFTLEGFGPFHASFSDYEMPTSACLTSGNATGTFSGSVNGWFTWVRTGSDLDIRTNGLPGRATFLVTSPLGNPCGGPVTAFVSGTLVF